MTHVKRRPPVILIIERKHIEKADIMPVLMLFNGGDVSKEAIWGLLGFLTLSVSGYDDDPRELWQIPEVRAWFTELERVFPQIVFYLCLDNGMINLFYSATRGDCTADDPVAYTSKEEVTAFLEESFYRMNRYLANFDIDYHGYDPYFCHCDAVAKTLSSPVGSYLC